jgi:hypothetical protein
MYIYKVPITHIWKMRIEKLIKEFIVFFIEFWSERSSSGFANWNHDIFLLDLKKKYSNAKESNECTFQFFFPFGCFASLYLLRNFFKIIISVNIFYSERYSNATSWHSWNSMESQSNRRAIKSLYLRSLYNNGISCLIY